MDKMAITPKGLRFLLIGLLVIISGFLLMMGGSSDDPAVFNYEMFDFQRLVAAPVVIVCGIIIEIAAIMGPRKRPADEAADKDSDNKTKKNE